MLRHSFCQPQIDTNPTCHLDFRLLNALCTLVKFLSCNDRMYNSAAFICIHRSLISQKDQLGGFYLYLQSVGNVSEMCRRFCPLFLCLESLSQCHHLKPILTVKGNERKQGQRNL